MIRRYRMNLGGGVPAGAPREPRVDRQNLQLPDLWSKHIFLIFFWPVAGNVCSEEPLGLLGRLAGEQRSVRVISAF